MDIKDRATVKYLLLDALGEFRDRRTPVPAYVEKRYDGHADSFKISKMISVEERVELASELRRRVDDILDVVCGAPDAEYWIIYSRVYKNPLDPNSDDYEEFAVFAAGTFGEIARSTNDVYIPVTKEEYDAAGEGVEKLDISVGTRFMTERALKIAKEDGRPHYKINDWKKVPLLQRTVRRTMKKSEEVKTPHPCPHCCRENDDGTWYAPCPSDDCPSHDEDS